MIIVKTIVNNKIVGTAKELYRLANKMHNKAGYEITIIGASEEETSKSDRLATLSFYSDKTVYISCDYKGVICDLSYIDKKYFAVESSLYNRYGSFNKMIYYIGVTKGRHNLTEKYIYWKDSVLRKQ